MPGMGKGTSSMVIELSLHIEKEQEPMHAYANEYRNPVTTKDAQSLPRSAPPVSIAHTDQIVGQLLDGGGCGTRLDRLRIVRYQDRLCGFDDQDACLALCLSLWLVLLRVVG